MSDRRSRYDKDDDDDFEEREPAGRKGEGRYPEVRSSAQDAIRRAGKRGKRRGGFRLSNLTERPAILVAAIIAGLVVLFLVGYFLFRDSSRPANQPSAPQQAAERANAPATETAPQPTQSPRPSNDDTALSRIFGMDEAATTQPQSGSWFERIIRIILRLALAALLASLLAFRPRKELPLLHRNPYVSQAQILLAVVASALMMIVADNAARAFGIFAAASLVRFRTTLRDPKDITILLISLGIGLATGVGRLELAIVLSLFVLAMLWVLEYYEPAQVYRALELTVKTRNVDETDEMLKDLFDKYDINAEVREIDRQDTEDPVGKIVYYVNLISSVSPDRLSDEIFTADPDNVDSIEWDQKKSTSYIYR